MNGRESRPKFVCDAMLGTLARWLRFFGFDTLYPQPGKADHELATIAEQGGRWLLTRDGELAARGPRTLLLRSTDLDGQIVEVFGRLDLRPEATLDRSRCSECNACLAEVRIAEVESTVPPHVAATAPRFRRCEGCGRVYWRGSHGDRILSRMAAVLARVGEANGSSRTGKRRRAVTGTMHSMRSKRSEALNELEEVLRYHFRDQELLGRALRHGSAVTAQEAGSYQRLEFLGDAVIGLAVAHLLFDAFPDDDQGVLTRKRVHLVRSERLAERAALLGLDGWVEVGPSEELSKGRERTAMLEDLFEAVLGAIMLDGGYDAAFDFLREQFAEDLGTLDARTLALADPKSSLQEVAQGRGLPLPQYRKVGVSGPDHHRLWVYEVEWDGEIAARGEGVSKREAQHQAARRALVRLGLVPEE